MLKKNLLALATLALLVPVAAFAVDDDKDKKDDKKEEKKEEKTPTIKDVMTKLHKGSSSETKKLDKLAKAEPTDWEAIGKVTKDFVILGAAMAKNTPPKGDKESWKKLADKYYTDAKSLDTAATDKSMDKLKAAQKTMGGSCKACHNAHKED